MTATSFSITDHAILRFLERAYGLDVETIRSGMLAMVEESMPMKQKDNYWHPDGIVFVVGRRGHVCTVLAGETAEKHRGRKLKSGQRVPLFIEASAP